MSDATKYVSSWGANRDKILIKKLEANMQYICTKEGIPPETTSRYINNLTKILNECSEEATNTTIFSYGQSENPEDTEIAE
jgi:DNA-directed RNA polymerase subunit F